MHLEPQINRQRRSAGKRQPQFARIDTGGRAGPDVHRHPEHVVARLGGHAAGLHRHQGVANPSEMTGGGDLTGLAHGHVIQSAKLELSRRDHLRRTGKITGADRFQVHCRLRAEHQLKGDALVAGAGNNHRGLRRFGGRRFRRQFDRGVGKPDGQVGVVDQAMGSPPQVFLRGADVIDPHLRPRHLLPPAVGHHQIVTAHRLVVEKQPRWAGTLQPDEHSDLHLLQREAQELGHEFTPHPQPQRVVVGNEQGLVLRLPAAQQARFVRDPVSVLAGQAPHGKHRFVIQSR